MIDFLRRLLLSALAYLPFLFFLWLDSKANLKRRDRSTQFLLPVLTLIYCAVIMICLDRIGTRVLALIWAIPDFLEGLPYLSALAPVVRELLEAVHPELLLFYALNAALLAAHLVLKGLCLPLLALVCQKFVAFADDARSLLYEQDPVNGVWFLKPNFAQGRTFIKTLFLTAVGISLVVARIAMGMYLKNDLSTLFYPVFGGIVLGELYFFINGLSRDEYEETLSGEGEKAVRFCNYVPLRSVLRKLFPDKLVAENTTMGTSFLKTSEEGSGLYGKTKTGDAVEDAYYSFMYRQQRAGLKVNPGYLASGLSLTKGKSVLFNNPFYYDLIPYAFYAMNTNLLRHKKVLVILGRHGAEKDIETWLEDGLSAVTNIPGMWKTGVLTDKEQDLDVGIITRSGVYELDLHVQNEDFFLDVGMIVLIEPSRLLTTAQVGLNSIIRRCKKDSVTYCSTDRNCDGLVDALSHLLMTSITEVSATDRHEGTCSYMCWEPDNDKLQHRLLPNISRYLGVGTELSFAALRNQVEKAVWYGGEAFPVEDMRWIAKQYYYDLLHYANLPTNQEQMDHCFRVSHNLWNERTRENGYFVVEDESRNMFEIKREFATRATGQSFINIISPQYLLHDYMAMNEGMFNADPKAVPTIVADYAGTQRNVTLRLFLRMSLGDITKKELSNELQIIGEDGKDPIAQVWHLLCKLGQGERSEAEEEKFVLKKGKGEFIFRRGEVIESVRKFSVRTGEIDDFVRIADRTFQDALLSDLRNARYISEEENGNQKYIGSELIGHVFQKYLPSQFFTFEGKYYEMLRITPEGQVILRRAADHITGRQTYRQIRRYEIRSAEDSTEMGACRTVNGMRITRQFANLSVETDGYWQMESYQNFETGKKVALNGIPARTYYNKQILCVALGSEEQPLDEKICETLTLLLNEVFRTVFAENSDYIVAVCRGEHEKPMTYSLSGADGFEPKPGCIYFIEDSQLDLGLLVAAERNLLRIFEIVCDYLDWHFEEVERSKSAPPPVPVIDLTEPEKEEKPSEDEQKAERKGIFRRIKEWFAKLLRKKKEAEPANDTLEKTEDGETPDESAADGDWAGQNIPEELLTGDTDAAQENDPTELGSGETAEPEEEGSLISFSISAPTFVGEQMPERTETANSEQSAETDASTDEMLPAEQESAADGEKSRSGEEDIEFEAPENAKTELIRFRKPYHERCYLYYGAAQIPECLDIVGTLELLKKLGFADRELSQARHGRDLSAQIEGDYRPNLPGVHYCDFCGAELTGTEHDVLKDGRESCVTCSKTAVRTEEEFRNIYHELLKNLEVFYGMHIGVPVKIQMVNAGRLHKKLGLTFVPSAAPDPRVLGVAIRDKKGKYTILVENGAPRIRSAMTMVHELTHIWQYTNWNMAGISQKYGTLEKEVYEGMAKWSEIQYAYLIGESAIAKREEISTALREDEYGRGFLKYAAKYPISPCTHVEGQTPFDNKAEPL